MKTDLEIQKDVQTELKWQPFLKSSEIGVSVKDGIVTLSGEVDSYAKKISAEGAAKKVEGVTAVVQKLEVNVGNSGKRTDLDIAESVRNNLKWSSNIPGEHLKAVVEHGIVTLEGDTEWEYQRKAAEKAIENLKGVTGVINKIKLNPKLNPDELRNKIQSALVRSATVDAEKISIDVHGNRVILNGKVRSIAEKKDAETAAWLAPGVLNVENNIKVETEILAY